MLFYASQHQIFRIASEDREYQNDKPTTKFRETRLALGPMQLIQRCKSWSWKSLIFLSSRRKVSQGLALSPINLGTPY